MFKNRSKLLLFGLIGIALVGMMIAAIVFFNVLTGTSDPSQGIFHNDPNAANVTPAGSAARTFQVGDQPVLIISGHNSNVDVHTGNVGSISVTIRAHNSNAPLNPDNASVRFDQSQNAQGHDQLHLVTDPAYQDVDYSISAPASTSVQVSVDSGQISLSGLGGASIETGSGSLHVDTIHGPVNVHTASGDITVRDSTGSMTIIGQSGSLHLTNLSGAIQASTESGDVIAQAVHLSGNSALKTTNGSVRFNGSLDPQGAYRMETMSGDIDAALPSNAAFQLQASTNSGAVHNDFGSDRVGTGSRWPLLTLTVTNGSVNVTRSA